MGFTTMYASVLPIPKAIIDRYMIQSTGKPTSAAVFCLIIHYHSSVRHVYGSLGRWR